tara:strand:- start:307 stop:714 length:408 start_codon:yes stop_codon:yes gene_type:complete
MPVKNKDNVVIEKVLNVEEDRLKYRVEYIRENLVQLSKKLRELVPKDLTDQDLTQDNTLKQWVIVNSIYDASMKDESHDGFNRMLYFLFDKAKGNIPRLVNNYDIAIKLNGAGQLEDMSLVVLETETHESENNDG